MTLTSSTHRQLSNEMWSIPPAAATPALFFVTSLRDALYAERIDNVTDDAAHLRCKIVEVFLRGRQCVRLDISEHHFHARLRECPAEREPDAALHGAMLSALKGGRERLPGWVTMTRSLSSPNRITGRWNSKINNCSCVIPITDNLYFCDYNCQTTKEEGPMLAPSTEYPKLLARRMAALSLDADIAARFDPDTFRGLRTVCSTCESTERCEVDLARDEADPIWQKYCPNCAKLRQIGRLPWLAGLVVY
jgi:hypothetical protein